MSGDEKKTSHHHHCDEENVTLLEINWDVPLKLLEPLFKSHHPKSTIIERLVGKL